MTGDKKTIASLPGFSVIEMLVVVAVFSFSILILSQTYLSFIRLSHRTANSSAVQQDMRFVLEYITRMARHTAIEYPVPPGSLDAATSTLVLSRDDQPAWIIKLSDTGDVLCGDLPEVKCLLVSSDAGVNWAPITSKKVNVEKFQILVRPSVTPFVLSGNNYVNNQQPFVTLLIKMTYMAPNDREVVSLEAQTSISSRVYVR